MTKKYTFLLLILFFFTLDISAQEVRSNSVNKAQENNAIEGLNIYPNPVKSGKLYIVSKTSIDKKIEIFDVLGKKVFETTTAVKEVNISSLLPGVYVIKVKEGEATATRKLIIN